MVGGGCPPPGLPRCRVRADAGSAPASPLVSSPPPGTPLPGTAAGYPLETLSCMSWAPQSSGGPRGAAVLRPSHVGSSGDSTYVRFSILLWQIRWLCFWSGVWHFCTDRNRLNWCHCSFGRVCTKRSRVQRWSTHKTILAPKMLVFPSSFKISFGAIALL